MNSLKDSVNILMDSLTLQHYNIHFSTLLTILDTAGSALADYARASGYYYHTFDPRSEPVLWVKPGTTEAKIHKFLAN